MYIVQPAMRDHFNVYDWDTNPNVIFIQYVRILNDIPSEISGDGKKQHVFEFSHLTFGIPQCAVSDSDTEQAPTHR